MINLNMDILLQVAAIFFLAFDRANNQGDFIKPYINSGKKIYQLLHEDNVAYLAIFKKCYIKGDKIFFVQVMIPLTYLQDTK